MILRRLWINSPSVGGPWNHLHGTNLLGHREENQTGSLYRVYPLSGEVASFQMPGLYLSDGWLSEKDLENIAKAKEKRMADDLKDTTMYTSNKFFLVYRRDGGNPVIRHPDIKTANEEAQRLAKKHPGKEFFVLQALNAYQSEILEPRLTLLR